MYSYYTKSAGSSIILAAVLLLVTMVLHPSSGSIEKILNESNSLSIIHSLAIFSIPILMFGLWGLAIAIKDKYRFTILGFIFTFLALISAFLAALINGLALPFFLEKYTIAGSENVILLKTIADYSFALNTSLTYTCIAFFCISILIYSITILLCSKFAKWIGYLGVSIVLFAIIIAVNGFVLKTLYGFRVFSFGLVGWLVSIGIQLLRSK